jgi:hypothetical protein
LGLRYEYVYGLSAVLLAYQSAALSLIGNVEIPKRKPVVVRTTPAALPHN